MKQSDIISIAVIAVLGILIAYFGVNAIMGNPDDLYAEYKTIGAVTTALAEPDDELFNKNAINPTVEVYIGTCRDEDGNGMLSEDELKACEEQKKKEAEEAEKNKEPEKPADEGE